jgi:hypothetical protein
VTSKIRIVSSVAFSMMLALGAAIPAAAQSPDNTAPAPAFTINATFLPDAPVTSTDDVSFDEQAGAPKTHAMGDRQVFLRLDGGLVFCCSHTGFVVGASVSAMPKSVKNIEIDGGFGIGRFAGRTFFSISADGAYDIHIQGHEAMPFIGAGFGIRHAAGATNAAFEILGGVQLPVQGPHVVRVSVKFLFSTLTTTVLLGSYSF